MRAHQPEDADTTKREPNRRRMNRVSGAIFAAFIGLGTFANVASNPRFQAIHTLDVIRLMTAGAGFAVALVLLIDFSFPGHRPEPKKEKEQGTS